MNVSEESPKNPVSKISPAGALTVMFPTCPLEESRVCELTKGPTVWEVSTIDISP